MKIKTVIGFALAVITVAFFINIGCSFNPFGSAKEDETLKEAKNMIIPLQEGNTWVYEYNSKKYLSSIPDTSSRITLKIQSIVKDSNGIAVKISFIDSGVYLNESLGLHGTVWAVDTSWYTFSNQTLLSGGDSLVWNKIRTLLAFEKQRDTLYYNANTITDMFDSLSIVTTVQAINFNSCSHRSYHNIIIHSNWERHGGYYMNDTTIWIDDIGLYRKSYVYKGSLIIYSRNYHLLSFYSENQTASACLQKPVQD